MKLFLTALAALLLSVTFTLLARQDTGYVLVGHGPWVLETRLTVAVLLLLALALALYLLARLLLGAWSAPRRLRLWEERRAQRKARQGLLRGLLLLEEGDFWQAEQQLLRGAERSEMAPLHYLAAARAAQRQGRLADRDRYLRQAGASAPAAPLAVGLVQAELLLACQEEAQALALLEQLRQLGPRHIQVLRLLADLYERQGQWQSLLHLLPELRRQRLAREPTLESLELRAQRGLLLQRAEQGRVALEAHWNGLSRAWQQHPELLDAYTGWLAAAGEGEAAERVLRESLGVCWSATLVERYGRLPSQDPRAQLAAAEAWLGAHPKDPVLLFTVGLLCLRNRLWGKARSCFEASIGAGGPLLGAAYRELGALLERVGERERALACYREGLALTTGQAAQAPAPTPLPLAVPHPVA